MNTEIKSAIARSVSHNEIVRVTVADADAQAEARQIVNLLPEVDDVDHSTENDGSLDVWGTMTSGDDFRIRISKA